MRLRIKLSISINEHDAPVQHGPDTEAQIGHYERVDFADTGMGFVPPGPKVDEAWDD